MADPIENYPAVWHRIMRQHQILLSGLSQEYCRSRPNCTEYEFREMLDKLSLRLPLICLKEGIDKQKLCEFIDAHDAEGIESDISFIYFSCAYILASDVAVRAWSIDLGWQLQCQANFYYALAFSTDRKKEIFTEAVVGEYQKSLSTRGGKKKAEVLEKYRARAEEILKSKEWKSLGQAANHIANQLEKEFPKKTGENGKGIEVYKRSTVKAWLRDLPEQVLDNLIFGYEAARERGKAAARKVAAKKKILEI